MLMGDSWRTSFTEVLVDLTGEFPVAIWKDDAMRYANIPVESLPAFIGQGHTLILFGLPLRVSEIATSSIWVEKATS